jgi:hypothetical protein
MIDCGGKAMMIRRLQLLEPDRKRADQYSEKIMLK